MISNRHRICENVLEMPFRMYSGRGILPIDSGAFK